MAFRGDFPGSRLLHNNIPGICCECGFVRCWHVFSVAKFHPYKVNLFDGCIEFRDKLENLCVDRCEVGF